MRAAERLVEQYMVRNESLSSYSASAAATEKEETGMAEEKVRVKLFKDNGRYKSDLFVSVNGVNYMIRRGVEVEGAPGGGRGAGAQSQHQDDLTAARIAAAEDAAGK